MSELDIKLDGHILHRGGLMINVPMSIKHNDFGKYDGLALWQCVTKIQQENAKLRDESEAAKSTVEYWCEQFRFLRTQFDEMQQRAKKAEAERDELERKRGCIRELFLDLDEMEQESKEFHELLQRIFDASMLDSSSERLLQERYIEQQIKALDTLAAKNTDDDAIYMTCQEEIKQLRKELEK